MLKKGQQNSYAFDRINLLYFFTFAFFLFNFLFIFSPQQVSALTKPIQLSPAKDAIITSASVSFSWSHPYNDQYEIKIKTKGGTLKYASGKISSKSKTVDLSKIPLTYGSTYKWYVVVYANGQEDSSDDRWFTYKFDGYCSVSSGVTISTNPVKIGQNFNISFTLKERRGAPKTFENVAIAILRSDNSFVFDFAMYSNITIPANGTWSQTATNKIYATQPAGTYKAVVRGKYQGAWFDFDTVNAGVNPKSFSATGILPGSVSASPTSGSWTSSPRDVSVGSSNATRIYYTIRTTTDGSTPANPPEPTSSVNDGSISGASGTFQVYANAGDYKKLKVRFRGYNSNGYGVTSGSFSYTIDLRATALPGSVSASPTSGSWTTSPRDVSVGSSNATRIYYTIRTTTDGSTPANPPEPTSSVNDGSISGASGTFQVYANAGDYKKLKVRFRGYNSNGYGSTSGSFFYTIDLRTSLPVSPGFVSVNPTSGSWTTSPKNVSVSCSDASRIYYTIRTTTDGSTPANPPEPTSSVNDGSISGASGTFQVYANAGDYKKLKVRFRGYNSNGYGVTSGSFSYTIDLRTSVPVSPGFVSVNPTSGSWTTSPKNVSVSCSDASRIYYTIRTTTDGSTPANPPEPTSSVNDGSISGASGTFQVYANAGDYKKLKVRFRGYNSNGYGSTSGSFFYTIDLRTSLPVSPGFVSVNPTSGSWTTSPKNVSVSCSDASRIYYTIRTTTDGSTPANPPEPTSSVNDGSISGASGTFQVYANAGDYKKLKVRFRGYNSNGYGVTSGSFSYTIDLRTSVPVSPGFVSVNPTSGSWTTSPKNVSVSCSDASRIYYTIRTTTDGSTPANPPEPTSSVNDGSISGASGTFQVYANAGDYKKLKVRFRGYNSNGYGSTSGSFSYTIDLRTSVPVSPGFVSVNPTSGSWTTSPKNVSVSCSDASRIYYTIRTTTDGSTPANPPEPSSGTNEGSISGDSGTFQVYASSGQYKKLKVRFRGYNSSGYGETSGSFSYTIDLRTSGIESPGAVSINPTIGSWTSSPRNVSVSCNNATRIYYTIRATTDGSTPADPPEPSSDTNDGSISGGSGTFEVYASAGQYKQLKVRFRGYNGSGYGVTSGSFFYTIDRRSVVKPGTVSVNPGNGNWDSSPKNVSVCSTNASIIFYTISATTNGNTPADPPEPSLNIYDGYILGAYGNFQVYASAGQYKRLKVRFRGYNSSGYGITSGSFSYTIDRISSALAKDDHGNTLSSATWITLSYKTGKASGFLTAGDYDYFRIPIPLSGTLTVYTTGNTDTYGYLLSSGGTKLRVKDDDESNSSLNFRISQSLPAGTYYVAVRHRDFSNGTGNYTLNVQFDRSNSGSVKDDHGNDCPHATNIPLVNGSGSRSGSLSVGDKDYFSFAVPAAGTLTVFTTGTTDTWGYLKNSDYRTIDDKDSGNGGGNFRINQPVSAGTYYVEVRHYNMFTGTGDYTLNVQFTSSTNYVLYPLSPTLSIAKNQVALNNLFGAQAFGGTHTGLDIMKGIGSPVYSVGDGIVKINNTNRNYGSAHLNYWNSFLVVYYPGLNIYVYYGHLVSSLAVEASVTYGQNLGILRGAYNDSNVRTPSADHLHLGVKTNLINSGWGYTAANTPIATLLKQGWRDPLELMSGR